MNYIKYGKLYELYEIVWTVQIEHIWTYGNYLRKNHGKHLFLSWYWENHGKLWSKKLGTSSTIGQIGGFPARCEEKYGINITDFEGTNWTSPFSLMICLWKHMIFHGYVGLPMMSRIPASPSKNTHTHSIVRNMWFHPLLSKSCFLGNVLTWTWEGIQPTNDMGLLLARKSCYISIILLG